MKMTKDRAKELGREAFKNSKPRMSNPFSFAAQQKHYLSWDEGWVKEWVKAGGMEPKKVLA